nr:hypothetical protein CFP56_16350 [Quercus suber]
MAMVKSSDFCVSFEKVKSECVEESLKKGEDATQLLIERVLKDIILFSSTKRRPLPQKDFNNGSKSECFTTENTPKKPRIQPTPNPYTYANGETPIILSNSKTHGDFNNGSKSECFTTKNTPKKPRNQCLALPKPDTNANDETPVILSKYETHGDFNNGSKSEFFATENTPKKPRTQHLASPKPNTNTNGETTMVLSLNVSQQKTLPRSLGINVWLCPNLILMPMMKLQLFYQSLKLREISTMVLNLNFFATENTPKKPRTQHLASPKPNTNNNGETPVNLSKTEILIDGKVPITKAVKKLRFIFDGKELKSPAKRTHTSVSKNSEKPQPPKRRRRTNLHVPPSPPDLPEDIRNSIREMYGTQEVFIIQKSL